MDDGAEDDTASVDSRDDDAGADDAASAGGRNDDTGADDSATGGDGDSGADYSATSEGGGGDSGADYSATVGDDTDDDTSGVLGEAGTDANPGHVRGDDGIGGSAATAVGGTGSGGSPDDSVGTAAGAGEAGAGRASGTPECSTTALPFSIVDAEYSAALDRIIVFVASPSAVVLLDPRTRRASTVEFPLAGSGISVAPDGTEAQSRLERKSFATSRLNDH